MRSLVLLSAAAVLVCARSQPNAVEEMMRAIAKEATGAKKGPCMGCGNLLGPVQVQTPLGQVEGNLWDRVNGTKTAAFLGIPYATQKRFEKASPMTKWNGVFDAKSPGPACPQGGTVGDIVLEDMSEDCLTANVFTPAAGLNGTGVALPVLFWIHGGGLTIGSSYSQGLAKMFNAFNIEHIYDGQRMAGQGKVVVISVNYRLGVLGYTPFGNSPGNLGYLDQQEGMRWAHKMAPSFGGDPKKVTIFGESAGGWSVLFHLASPLAKDLFQHAIVESGGIISHTRNQTLQHGIDVAKKLGCSGDAIVSCMKSKTYQDIITAQGGGYGAMGSVGATIEAPALPTDMQSLFASGNFNRKPTIIGNNRDEASIFGGCRNITAEEYKTRVAELYPSSSTEVLKLYPVDSYPMPRDAMVTLESDRSFCTANRDIANMEANVSVPAFRYRLVRSAWFIRMLSLVSGMKEAQYCVGVPHAAELIDVFGTFDNLFANANGDLALSQHVIQAWTNFAHSGSPNKGGPMGNLLPSWQQHTATEDTTYVLDAGSTLLYPKGTDKSHNVEKLLADKCQVLSPASRNTDTILPVLV